MEKHYLTLNDVRAYKLSFNLANKVWAVFSVLDYFNRNTLSDQIVRSTDSISANIAEGFGRFNKKDKIKFYYYSRASVLESLDWLEKAKVRKLISLDNYQEFFKEFTELPQEINGLIKITRNKLDK